jgi:hypothetical protein
MLNVYTRHAAECDHADDLRWRRCRCPKWIRGVLPNGDAVRESAKTRSWEQAERKARERELAADPNAPTPAKPQRATVKDAVELFIKDEQARGAWNPSPGINPKPCSNASFSTGAKRGN